jgi:hypothetical protein
VSEAGETQLAGHGLGQGDVRWGKVERPVLVNQFIAELRVTRTQGTACGVIEHDAAGPHQQERVGLAVTFQIEALLTPQVRIGRNHCGGQRVVAIQRSHEIVAGEADAFRLQDDQVVTALQIDRPAVG